MRNLKRVYTENPDKPETLRFFCHGERYSYWGLVEGDLHLVCPPKAAPSSCSAPTGSAATCSRA